MAEATEPQAAGGGVTHDPGADGPLTLLHRASLVPPPAARAGQGEPGQPEAQTAGGAERLPVGPALPAERRARLRDILASIRDGGQPLGPLALAAVESPPPAAGKGRGKAAPAERAAPAAPDSDARRWPSGPLVGTDLFSADEVRQIVEAILTDEEIMAHPTMPGLTRARLREAAKRAGFEPSRFGRFSSALVIWLAEAGVTVLADDKAAGDWARPRPLIGNSRAEIRRRLSAVDPPDAASAAAIARTAGFNSSSL